MNICVFGSSSEHIDKSYLANAEALGREIALRGHTLIFGAGKYGVMGACVRGAHEKGGQTIGVTPDFFIGMDVVYENCTHMIVTETMRERKAIMEEKSDAFVICAGGMGTFEEFFEVLTLKQLQRHSKPIIVYNFNGYYNPMLGMFDESISQKFMSEECKGLFTVAGSVDEIFDQLENYVPFGYDKYAALNKFHRGESENG